MIRSNFICKSRAAKKLEKEVLRFAKLQKHVLILGERGVGKTTIATLLHSWSNREGRLVVLNATAMAEEEVKALLEKEPKNLATVVFQEIQDFSFLYQAKINQSLRKLPQKPFVQIIITSQHSLDQLRVEGRLLDDLYASIKDFEELVIPPLRERREDIPLLVEHFIKTACESMNIRLDAIDVNILDFLVRREWTGNVAELKSVIESTVVTSRNGTVELPESLVNEEVQLENMIKNIHRKKVFSFDSSLSNLEKTLIVKTLDAVDYNQTRAAEILNLSEANLRYRLRKFHILSSRKK